MILFWATIFLLGAINPPTALRLGDPRDLRLQKVTLAWSQPGSWDNVAGWKLWQGGHSMVYTNSVFVRTTNAVCYVWPGQTYYFHVTCITTITNAGVAEVVEGDSELRYTVPRKGPNK